MEEARGQVRSDWGGSSVECAEHLVITLVLGEGVS